MPTTSEDAGDTSPLPPRDLLAEKAVLGAALLSKDAIADVVEVLPSDFYEPNHQAIYERSSPCTPTGGRPTRSPYPQL
jgi:hypothetical protein